MSGGWGSMLMLAREKCQLLGSCSEQAGQDDSLEKPQKSPSLQLIHHKMPLSPSGWRLKVLKGKTTPGNIKETYT